MNAETIPRRRLRFSLMSLLLFMAVVALSISHFQTSQTLHKTQTELETANNELGYLTIDNPDDMCAIALPTFVAMQWRWRLHLPPSRRYRIRWFVDNVPQTDLPDAPSQNQIEFFNVFAEPFAYAESIILTVAVQKNDAGKWVLTAAVDNTTATIHLTDAPAWLDNKNGDYLTQLTGRDRTEAVAVNEPLVLLRYRKAKQTPVNRLTADAQPADGLVVWIEKVPKK